MSEKSNQFVITVFSKLVVLGTKVPFNKSEVIAYVRSIRLSVRIDWRNFALALTTRIYSAELPSRFSA